MSEIISAPRSRILLISKKRGAREILHAALAEAGHHVLPSDHALEPSDVLQLRPDLFVLDMNSNTGWDYVRTLRSLSCTSRIPILACARRYPTGAQLEGTDGRSVLAILRRPFEKKYFLDAVECASSNQLGVPKSAPATSCLEIETPQDEVKPVFKEFRKKKQLQTK